MERISINKKAKKELDRIRKHMHCSYSTAILIQHEFLKGLTNRK